MFICDDCLKEHYTNHRSLFRSYGPCEICGKPSDCSDIRSKNLCRKIVEEVSVGE
jgi:hypothetical protein